MPVTVVEKWDSREQGAGDQPSVDLRFLVIGTPDDIPAHSELIAQTPQVYNGLVRQSTHLERIAEDAWEGSVRYGPYEPPSTGDSSYSFDTGGGTQHITQSLGTVGAWGAPGIFPPNFHGAIGATQDSIEGVDITVPIYNFSETHYIDAAFVTGAYKAALFYLTGTVNNGPFRGFAAGEVLFLGAAGSVRGQENWEVAYRFAASPNVMGLSVGSIGGINKRLSFEDQAQQHTRGLSVGSIGGINKRGWDYLWVRYADIEDPAAKMLVKRPLAVYVEQVYPFTNFLGLGIGT